METVGMWPCGRRDFRVAIVCALPVESTAVIAMFDERWDVSSFGKLPRDTNEYTVGRICSHNVVLAYLPSMGTNSAAASINSLYAAFESIELVLAVGVCGGVPNTASEEVILGDVIVSKHIVQYDYGRQYPHAFRPKDTIRNSLPRYGPRMRSFLHRISTLQGKTELLQNTHLYLQHMLEQFDFLSWKRPLPTTDRLFDPKYRHKHQQLGICRLCDECQSDADETCEDALKASCAILGCSDQRSVPPERVIAAIQEGTFPQPQIHFGIVASGNQVMKSASHRDAIVRREGVVAFEMEGAGLCDYGPTLIVKGVCDYADSHKNKDWQRYASAAAASCMKALIHEWRDPNAPKHPYNTRPAPNTEQDWQATQNIVDTLWFREIMDRFNGVENAQFESFRWIYHEDKRPLLEWNSSTKPYHCNNFYTSPLAAYMSGFHMDPMSDWDPCGLKVWLSQGEGIYWITGKPGCGKSTLMKFIYEDGQYKRLLSDWAAGCVLLMPSFFSWRAGSGLQKNQLGLLQTVLYQILKSHPRLVSRVLEPVERQDIVREHQANRGSSQPMWTVERAQSIFTKLLRLKNVRMCILLDGLDEMEWKHLDMAEYLIQMTRNHQVKFLLSGRYLTEFSATFYGCKTIQLHEWTLHDVDIYVRTRILGNQFIRQEVEEDRADFEALVKSILQKAEGVFIWVKTAVTALVEGIYRADTIRELKTRLDRLPTEIYDLYETIIHSLDKDYVGDFKKYISLILAAESSQLTSPVISLATNYDLTRADWILSQSSMDAKTFKRLQSQVRRRLHSICSQFISIHDNKADHAWEVAFMHKTVYDFFKLPKMQEWLSTGSHDPEYCRIANRIAGLTSKFTGLKSFNRCTFLLTMLDFRIEHSELEISADALVLSVKQLETATFEWIDDEAISPHSQQLTWDQRYDYFTARAGASYLMGILSKNRHRRQDSAFLSLMLYGKMIEVGRKLLSVNSGQLTTEDRVDILMIGTLPSQHGRSWPDDCCSKLSKEDIEALALVSEYHFQDPKTIDLYWQKIVLIMSCQASTPPGGYRPPGYPFFARRCISMIRLLLELGVDVNVLVQCCPPEVGRPVLQSPLRVFRRCEAFAKTLITFFPAKAGWTPGVEREHVEEISAIIDLLLQYGAEDLEQTPSVVVDQPEESEMIRQLSVRREFADHTVSQLPKSEDMSGDEGYEFVPYDAEEMEMEWLSRGDFNEEMETQWQLSYDFEELEVQRQSGFDVASEPYETLSEDEEGRMLALVEQFEE